MKRLAALALAAILALPACSPSAPAYAGPVVVPRVVIVPRIAPAPRITPRVTPASAPKAAPRPAPSADPVTSAPAVPWWVFVFPFLADEDEREEAPADAR